MACAVRTASTGHGHGVMNAPPTPLNELLSGLSLGGGADVREPDSGDSLDSLCSGPGSPGGWDPPTLR